LPEDLVWKFGGQQAVKLLEKVRGRLSQGQTQAEVAGA
jgi:hypothetical protein